MITQQRGARCQTHAVTLMLKISCAQSPLGRHLARQLFQICASLTSVRTGSSLRVHVLRLKGLAQRRSCLG